MEEELKKLNEKIEQFNELSIYKKTSDIYISIKEKIEKYELQIKDLNRTINTEITTCDLIDENKFIEYVNRIEEIKELLNTERDIVKKVNLYLELKYIILCIKKYMSKQKMEIVEMDKKN